MPATKKLKVSVTAEDIERGVGHSDRRRPLAIAILRALPSPHWTTVVSFSYDQLDTVGRLEIMTDWTTLLDITSCDFPNGLEEFAVAFDEWDDYRWRGSDAEYFADKDDDCPPERPKPFEFKIELPEASHASD